MSKIFKSLKIEKRESNTDNVAAQEGGDKSPLGYLLCEKGNFLKRWIKEENMVQKNIFVNVSVR